MREPENELGECGGAGTFARGPIGEETASPAETPHLQRPLWRRVVSVGQAISRGWRVVTGDAADLPFVEVPLTAGPTHVGDVDRPPVQDDTIEDVYPLSPLQHGMLIQSLQVQRFGVDIEQVVCELREDLNVPAFRRAWQRTVARHPILRTGFLWEGSHGPRQEVHRHVAIPWLQADWRGLSARERFRRLEAFLQLERTRGFDLTAAPVMRMALIREGKRRYRFCWTFHHLLLDARVGVLKRVFESYEAFSRGGEPAVDAAPPYRTYIDWLRQQDWSRAEAYWRHLLQGFHTPTPVVIAKTQPRTLAAAEVRGEKGIKLSNTLTATLKTLARENNLTLNTLVQGAWALLLGRYSGEEDVVFGAIRSCRRSTVAGADKIVGLLINTVPVRLRLPSDMMLLPWLTQLRRQWVAHRDHEHTPLIKVQGWSEVPRGSPLFETLVNFQDLSWHAVLRAQGGSWKNRAVRHISQPGFPLVLDGYGGLQLQLKLRYDRRRLDDACITRMLGHVKTLLEGMAADPCRSLGTLPLLTAGERRQLLVTWNQTQTAYPRRLCVHQLFERQVQRRPNNIAVAFEDQRLSYRELNRQANQVAHYLRTLGVGPDVLVGICVERSPEMVVGLLGIVKAGGAYVPLDPTHPKERLASVMKDARVSVLLTQQRLLKRLPAHEARVVCLDADVEAIGQHPEGNPAGGATADNLAYVIYTSGSTGRPKGVMIVHRGLVNYLTWCVKAYGVAAGHGALVHSSISFDLTITGLLAPLMVGRPVHVLPEQQGVESLVTALGGLTDLSLVKITPAHLELLSRLLPAELAAGRTRALIIGGENLLAESIAFWQDHAPETALVNEYGPTETVVGCCTYRVPRVSRESGSVPIGRPIANTQLYILDRHLHPLPVGVAGELYIGGDGLARGYLNQPELTEAKFIANPFRTEPGSRLYKTGDLARYRADGNIEFLGRLDHQVKIRGFRIELGEIESVLAQHPAVREAVVVAQEHTPGDRRLVAYVVPKPRADLTIDPPRHFLKRKLPEYMVPSAVVVLQALPLSPNGKVDRRALPKPERTESESGAGFVSARTVTEEVVAGIWEGVLKVERVGVHDNFFELGGDSLLAIQALSRSSRAFQLDLSLGNLLETPTVAELSERIVKIQSTTTGSPLPAVVPGPRNQDLPLSFSQERTWTFCQILTHSARFAHPFCFQMRGPLDVSALQRSLTELVRRHEILRTTFPTRGGRPVQQIDPPEPVALPVLDLSSHTDPDAEAIRLVQTEAGQRIDLAKGPLFQAKLLRLGAEEHRLLLILHHILYDGRGRDIMNAELAILYSAYCRGQASPFVEPPLQFADFSLWQRSLLQRDGVVYQEQLAYWRQKLAGTQNELDLPLRRPTPAVGNLRDAYRDLRFPTELFDQMKMFGRREGATPFMTLLAAFKALLSHYTGREDILVGSYSDNRNRPGLEGVIGFFTNLLPLRTNLAGNPTFRELLARVRKTTLEALSHQDLPFEELSRELQQEGRQPLEIRVMFAVNDWPRRIPELQGLEVRSLLYESQVMPWGFVLLVRATGDEVTVRIASNTDLYDPVVVNRMLTDFVSLVEKMLANPARRLSELLPRYNRQAS